MANCNRNSLSASSICTPFRWRGNWLRVGGAPKIERTSTKTVYGLMRSLNSAARFSADLNANFLPKKMPNSRFYLLSPKFFDAKQ